MADDQMPPPDGTRFDTVGRSPSQPIGPQSTDQRTGTRRLRWNVEAIVRLGERPFFVALRHGLLLSLPLVMVGALAHFLNALISFPFAKTLLPHARPTIQQICASVVDGTFGLVALTVLIGFSYSLASLKRSASVRHTVSPAGAAMVALSCFVILVPPSDLAQWKGALSAARGLPTALIVTICASYLYLFLARRPLFRLELHGFGDDPTVGDIFSTLPAGVVTIGLFVAARQAQVAFGGPDISLLVTQLVAAPFVDMPITALSTAAITLASQVLWFVGAHGTNMLASVQDQLMTSASQANFDAVAAGLEPANIVNRQFFTVYSRIGGSGCTLCLIAALLIGDREPQTRRLALLSLLPALVNVNEPLVFGLPLILNPVYAVPFILTPVVLTLVGYFATAAGLVPAIGYPAPWTTPPFLNGYIATGAVSGILVQIVAVAIGTGIYLPFVRAAARLRMAANRQALRTLLVAAEATDSGSPASKLLALPGSAGRLANMLAQDLSEVLARGDTLYLEYQPQIWIDQQRVFGVEALLRWEHDVYGFIPPPVIVALAEDTRTIDLLGLQVLRIACRQRVAWAKVVPDDLVMSVNVSPRQLHDAAFDDKVMDILADEGLAPHLLELEITESTALLPAVHALAALHRLRARGVRIALDDFGMGHTSLHYLRELPLNTLKIDRSLTFSQQGSLNEHVVRSILNLSQTLGLNAVVEGIEQPEQLPRFIDLGCTRFQGYLFSRPLKSGACLEYIRANAGTD